MKPTASLQDMIQAIQSLADAEVLQNEFYPKGALPDSFFRSYPFLQDYRTEVAYLNDNQFVWKLAENAPGLVGGEFHFPEIEQSLALTDSYKQQFAESSPPEPPEYVLLIDEHPHAGDGHLLFLVVPPGSKQHEIWLKDENGNWYELALDLREYMQRLAEVWCIYNWYFFFLKDRKARSDFMKKYLKQQQAAVKHALGDHPFTTLKL